MSKTNLIVTDLDSLFENLCDVYNSYDKGKLKDNEVTTFTKTAKCMVSVKNQILNEKKFEVSLDNKKLK